MTTMSPEKLNEVYKEFVRWRARPLPQESSPLYRTTPRTVDDFCVLYNVLKEDVMSFTEKDVFEDDLLSESLIWARSKTPDVLHLVYGELVRQKDINSLEKFFNIVYELKKKKEDINNNTTNFNFINIPDEKFRSITSRLARKAGLLIEGSPE